MKTISKTILDFWSQKNSAKKVAFILSRYTEHLQKTGKSLNLTAKLKFNYKSTIYFIESVGMVFEYFFKELSLKRFFYISDSINNLISSTKYLTKRKSPQEFQQ